MVKNKLGKKNNNTPQIILIILMITILVIFLGALIYWMFMKNTEGLKANFCPNTGPHNHFVILIDGTENLSFTQKTSLTRRYQNLIEKKIHEGDLLSVFYMNEDLQASAQPVFEKCNPGSSAEKSELKNNLKRVDAKFQNKFLTPALNTLKPLDTKVSSKYSPIIEMLQLVSLNSFQKQNSSGQKYLFIISDMIQNVPQYSMYKIKPDYDNFKITNYGAKSKVYLDNVKVEINYLMNYPDLQTRRNALFWENFFNDSGAILENIIKVEG